MILMNDFKAEPDELQQEERCAVDRVMKSGWYILGEEVSSFEADWSRFCQTKHAGGRRQWNGRNRNWPSRPEHRPGGRSDHHSNDRHGNRAVAIIRAGAQPVLADISPQTALLDFGEVERCLTKRTRAVLLVHLYGQLRAMDEWAAFCGKHGIFLIEDCAQAHGSEFDGRVAGTFGVFGAYSFYPTKNLARKEMAAL